MSVQIRPSRAIGLLAAVTIALIATSVALLLWQMRKHELERARIETVSLAHMFREQTERTFDRADAVLRGVQERMQTAYGERLALDGTAVHLLLGARVLGNPQLASLTLVNAAGRTLNTSLKDLPPDATPAEAAYLKALAGSAAQDLFIGRPVRGPGGAWTLHIARPFSDANGTFRGVIAAVMNIPRFDQFYGWMKLDYARPIALYLADGTLVASLPQRENSIGDLAAELGSVQLPPVDGEVRMVTHLSGDGGRQVFALARAGRFPLLLSVTNDEEPALAAWREASIPIVLGAMLVSIFIVIAATLLGRELAREAVLARALRDAHDRYQRTIESVMDAIVAVDERQQIILFNPAAEQMFGRSAAAVTGLPLETLLPARARGAHAGHLVQFMRGGGKSRAMSPNVEITGLRSDGTEFPIESTISQTLVDGRPQLTAVLRDVTQHRRAEADLREMNRQLRVLSQSLQDVREQERNRIAMELHDDLGQQLTGLKLELSWLGGRMREGRPAAPEEFDAMRKQLDTAIASVRRIAAELRPRMLGDLGLGEAISWQAGELARRTGLAIALDLGGASLVEDDAAATALFRIVQEALTNIARHSAASEVAITLNSEGGQLSLVVSDNGKGVTDDAQHGTGIGVVSMRERAVALGGHFDIAPAPGGGTRIHVRVPLSAPVTEEEPA